jgi:hypothetical protein
MRRLAFFAVVAALVAVAGTGVARADQPPLDLAGQPFYFSATCTGIGDVILENQSLAHRPALRAVGTPIVVIPFFDSHGRQTNGECTFTGGGFTIDTIVPFDEPFSAPVRIA